MAPKHAVRCLECKVLIWHKDHMESCRFYKPPFGQDTGLGCLGVRKLPNMVAPQSLAG